MGGLVRQNGKPIYGLLIAPAYRNGVWTNDRSEMRRAQYDYWTVGHVLDTGIIVPGQDEPMHFSDPEHLIRFYRGVLEQLANPYYEQPIARSYAKYLLQSKDVRSEPFLIPELRYAALEIEHKYRLDYTVLNSHVMKFTGFELSPASTHMSVEGKDKKLKEHNAELVERWNNETEKRNDFFNEYNIPIVTFADKALQNMDACFAVIERFLAERPPRKLNVEEQLALVRSVHLP